MASQLVGGSHFCWLLRPCRTCSAYNHSFGLSNGVLCHRGVADCCRDRYYPSCSGIGSRIASTRDDLGQATVGNKRIGCVRYPVQSLASAIDAYTIAAHREVLYNGQLALGRQSTRVKGYFTPEAALQLLLEGTRLLPRYMAGDAFVLVADDRPLVPTNTASPDVVMRYYGRIQTSLRQAFCTNKRTRPGNYRVAVGFRIGPSGTVSRAALLGSTGDRDLDAMIAKLITGLAIGAPPPRGFAQPVVLMVSPQSDATARDCEAIAGRLGGVTP